MVQLLYIIFILQYCCSAVRLFSNSKMNKVNIEFFHGSNIEPSFYSTFLNDLQKSSDIKIDNKEILLKEKWEQILAKIELPSTRMLLSQQAELLSFNSSSIEIALSPNWENMIKTRKVVIENAIKKIYGDQVKLKFSSKELGNKESKNKQEKINDNNSQSIKNKPQNNNLPNELPYEESYKESSKNLANFFNGEIIDLDE